MEIGRLGRLGMALVLAVVAGWGAAEGQPAPHMAADARPSFEVATIKLSDPTSKQQRIGSDGNRMQLRGQTLTSMVMFAYGVHKNQILEGPGWRSEDRYDVDGIADAEGEPSLKQMQEMLTKLLVERFGLTFHHERREMVHYALAVEKGGPKMVKSTSDPEAQPDQTGNGDGKQMMMKFTNNSMDDFALGMLYFLDRPVVNETGLPGRFDFVLRWTPDEWKVEDGSGAPVLFTALREELGLKLTGAKGPVDVMVIDHVERPSAN